MKWTIAAAFSAVLWPFAGMAQLDCEGRDPVTAEVNSREGVRLAKAGDYEAAVALFRMASTLDACEPSYRLLLARALTRSGKLEDAQLCYAEILGSFPGTPEAERAQVEQAELKKRIIEEAQAKRNTEPPPVVQPPVEPDPPVQAVDSAATTEATVEVKKQFPWRIVGFSAAGVGAASVLGGVLFALDSKSADDDLKKQTYHGDRKKYDDLVDQRSSSATLSYVFYGVGGALIVGGVLAALLLPEKEQAPEGSTLGFWPSGEGGQFVFSTSF